MNKIAILILLSIFVMTGCQDNNSILEPINDSTVESLNKSPFFSPVELGREDEIIDNSKYPKYTKVMKKLAKNYTFNGDEGGKIIQKYTWYSEEDTLKLEAYLNIPQGAYEGELTFEIVFDPNLLSMELHPTPFYFDKPVELTMMYKGISEDFEFDSDNLDFKYYNPDGSFEEVDYHHMDWDPIDRELKVFQAELHHFSRYGWTRTREIDKKLELVAE